MEQCQWYTQIFHFPVKDMKGLSKLSKKTKPLKSINKAHSKLSCTVAPQNLYPVRPKQSTWQNLATQSCTGFGMAKNIMGGKVSKHSVQHSLRMYFTVTKAYGHVLKLRIQSKYILNKLLSKDHDVFQIAPSLSVENWQLPERETLKMAKAVLYHAAGHTD